jgi:membrane protein DedA with SNARE-associated domain
MIEQAVAYVQALVIEHGVPGVLFATLVEEIIAPIPSALVPLAAGFSLIPSAATMAEASIASLVLVAPAVALGIGIGSGIVYGIAYWGGKPAIDRFGSLLGADWQDIERAQAKLTGGRADEAILFGLRLVPLLPGVVISAMCGAIRYPFRPFIIVTLAGSYLRAFVLGLIGWQTGELYAENLSLIEEYEGTIIISVLALVALLILVHVIRKRSA